MYTCPSLTWEWKPDILTNTIKKLKILERQLTHAYNIFKRFLKDLTENHKKYQDLGELFSIPTIAGKFSGKTTVTYNQPITQSFHRFPFFCFSLSLFLSLCLSLFSYLSLTYIHICTYIPASHTATYLEIKFWLSNSKRKGEKKAFWRSTGQEKL